MVQGNDVYLSRGRRLDDAHSSYMCRRFPSDPQLSVSTSGMDSLNNSRASSLYHNRGTNSTLSTSTQSTRRSLDQSVEGTRTRGSVSFQSEINTLSTARKAGTGPRRGSGAPPSRGKGSKTSRRQGAAAAASNNNNNNSINIKSIREYDHSPAVALETEIPSYIDFASDPAHQFWKWSVERQEWYHKDPHTGEVIWAPTEFD